MKDIETDLMRMIKNCLADPDALNGGILQVLVGVKRGSIVFMLSFQTVELLDTFWQAYKDGSLSTLLAETFVTEQLKAKYKLSSIEFTLNLSDDDYDKCKQRLLSGSDAVPVEASMQIQDEEIESHCEKSAEAKRTEVAGEESCTGKR